MQDKRRAPRLQLELQITYAPQGLKEKLQCKGYAEDISKGGVLISTGAGDPITDLIQGKIHVPGESEPIEFEARMAWSGKQDKTTNKTGFQFTQISEVDRRRLEKLIQSVWMQMLTFY